MTELTEALDKLKGEFEGHYKAANDAAEAERKALGETTAETKALVTKVDARMDELEAEIKALADVPAAPTGDAKETKAAAFDKLLRKGVETLDGAETKALELSDDTEGGYLAPSEMDSEIVKGIIEWSPIRSIARVRSTGARSLKMPKRTGVLAAAWVAETGDRTETEGSKLGMDEVPNHELYAMVDISRTDLEDTDFDLEGYIRDEVAEQFGVSEGAAFVSGSGTGQPEGFLTYATLATVNSGHATQVTADGLLDLYYEPKSAYASKASWVMQRATVKEVRKLKDADNRYLWAPGLSATEPSTLLGRPIVEAPDMPAIAASAKAIAFGDFKSGYVIVDRRGTTVLRDPYTQAAHGIVRFHFHKRVGGQVRVADAIKTQTISA